MVYAVVTGGGTSGHVLPALAICELLADAGHDLADIRYVGTRRGVDKELMSQSGIASESAIDWKKCCFAIAAST